MGNDSCDRPDAKEEVEVTPQTIEAGVTELGRYDPESGLDDEATVKAIYLAMSRLSEPEPRRVA